ncbi:MAG: tryptophan synthase subunit alpha [Bacteroidota bacterium]
MNRLDQLFNTKKKDILNVYFTAGFPNLHDTEEIILTLESAGVDLIELGMPYSDPMADGPTIQDSSTVALKNGMNVELLFEQIASVREKSQISLIMMGYFNQVMQYGEERFFRKCAEVGVDGLILPDLPVYIFEEKYRALFEELDLRISFLISPQTSEQRIRQIDDLTKGFIYMVSSSSITGAKSGISEEQMAYFNRINDMQLKNPRLIGFGISDHATYATACQFSSGAIIGSAFIRALAKADNLKTTITEFVETVREPEPVA